MGETSRLQRPSSRTGHRRWGSPAGTGSRELAECDQLIEYLKLNDAIATEVLAGSFDHTHEIRPHLPSERVLGVNVRS